LERQSKGSKDLEAYCKAGQGSPRAVEEEKEDEEEEERRKKKKKEEDFFRLKTQPSQLSPTASQFVRCLTTPTSTLGMEA